MVSLTFVCNYCSDYIKLKYLHFHLQVNITKLTTVDQILS